METFSKELPFLNLPSTMWGIHIHPQYEFIGILHINISGTQLFIDKGILVIDEKYSLKAKIFLNGYIADIPNVVLDITNLSDISSLIQLLHDKSMCRNFAEIGEYPDCLKLIDNENNLIYCSSCQEKYTLRELTKNGTQYGNIGNYEVVSAVQISYSYDELSTNNIKYESQCLEQNIMCNEYIPQNEMISHKEERKPNENVIAESNNTKLENSKYEREQKQALCNFCGKIFPSGYRIEEHMLIHTQEKPFQCKFCRKSFSTSFNLRMHEYTHSGERPYICSVCGKSYTTSSNLRTHSLSNHSNDKKYACDICKMTFVYPRYLKLHMRKHTGERPFVCSTCGKKFSKNIHLKIHIRTHTGEKPHCCEICGKRFTTTGGLGYHKRVHHKENHP